MMSRRGATKIVYLSFLGRLTLFRASGQSAEVELARKLSRQETRLEAIALIAASAGSKLNLLVHWTKHTPEQIDEHEFHVGLADAFGHLKAKEGIPFLIKNISLQRWRFDVNIWLKSEKVVEERLPAVAALIRIGPEASEEIIGSYFTLLGEDRLAAIFAVVRIGDPRCRTFLISVLGQANLERHLAEIGLRRLKDQP